MSIDWSQVGTAAGAIFIGIGSWLAGRKANKATTEVTVAKAKAEGAQAAAETSVVELMRQEVERLGKRVEALEAEQRDMRSSNARLIRHIFRLEALMRGSGLEPPHFDIDGEPIKAGGSSSDD